MLRGERANMPFLLSLALVAAAAQDPAPVAAVRAREPAPVRLDLRVSPILELYQELRARAEAGEEPDAGDPTAAALAAARALHAALGRGLSWGPVDGRLGDCRTAEDLAAAFAELPETFTPRRPGAEAAPVPLRELAGTLARELAALEPRWLESEWPARAERLRAAAAGLDATLNGPSGAALYRDLCSAQGMTFDGLAVPVLLVNRAPWPGAVTFRNAAGGVCFVGVADVPAVLLAEIVVHETIHALDVSSQGQPTLLQDLRDALAAAGHGREDRRAADAAHALLFLHAAELVRGHLDPAHVDYGEREGVYGRLAAPIDLERELFRAYLRGELERPALVSGIVEALR